MLTIIIIIIIIIIWDAQASGFPQCKSKSQECLGASIMCCYFREMFDMQMNKKTEPGCFGP